MVQKIQLENSTLTAEEILAAVGGQLDSVVSLTNDQGLDVTVLTQESWEHLLSLLDAAQAEGYRIQQELPEEILREVDAPEPQQATGWRTDVPEKLHPAPDFKLEAGEIPTSDDILD
ncbi:MULTISPECIES: hypothetical protein [Enterococcus]|uniref:hypothetical protein n=1 Tax=Enterococcus TaxID=1350 RepID=UPI0010F82D8B|nr:MULTISPECIES: hypothetical protein [Enterococcus]KAF1302320.1 hypothetical protein BAU16_07220 [Enterococcus sp. JM9B]